jgi:hypothetical protein
VETPGADAAGISVQGPSGAGAVKMGLARGWRQFKEGVAEGATSATQPPPPPPPPPQALLLGDGGGGLEPEPEEVGGAALGARCAGVSVLNISGAEQA